MSWAADSDPATPPCNVVRWSASYNDGWGWLEPCLGKSCNWSARVFHHFCSLPITILWYQDRQYWSKLGQQLKYKDGDSSRFLAILSCWPLCNFLSKPNPNSFLSFFIGWKAINDRFSNFNIYNTTNKCLNCITYISRFYYTRLVLLYI